MLTPDIYTILFWSMSDSTICQFIKCRTYCVRSKAVEVAYQGTSWFITYTGEHINHYRKRASTHCLELTWV